MADYAAFLRGMNLGKRRITNDELRAHVEAMGFTGVQTFRASGNVIFDAAEQSDETLRERFENGLRAALDYDVPTFIRSRSEMLALADAQPFDLSGAAGKLQVALLWNAPADDARELVLALDCESDRLAFGARELFWLPAGRMSDSALDWKAIERALGATTVRTKGTIELIAAKHFA